MKILEKIVNFGLSEKEAQVYVVLLELEIAPVQEIADKTGLNRSSIYVVLSSLQKRGLAIVSSTEGATKYVAAHPDQLLRISKENVEKYNLLKQNFNSLLPELKRIHRGAIFKPKITVYEGDEGVIQAFDDTLKTKEGFIRICSAATYPFENIKEYFISYLFKRKDLNIKMLGVHPYNTMYKEIIKHMPKNFDEPIAIPEDKFKFPSDLAIFDNNIGFMSITEPFSVIMKSQDLADTVKTLFDLAREEAKRLSKTLK